MGIIFSILPVGFLCHSRDIEQQLSQKIISLLLIVIQLVQPCVQYLMLLVLPIHPFVNQTGRAKRSLPEFFLPSNDPRILIPERTE